MRGLCLLLVVGAAWAADGELDGRMSLRGLYSADDGGNPSVGMLFLDADTQARGLTAPSSIAGSLELVLDAGFVLDATEAQARRFGRTESLDQVRQAYVQLPKLAGRVDLRSGRVLRAEAGNAWVDGLDAQLWFPGERA
ncbi:MAG: hypothetical protein GY812_17720, partial [Actinomycetia bacterium]|nr:hypothetical protein [Actinomycetes bacterium]